ncbi:hypothetical protein [Furfurilactobacillus curtus]|uniref:Uncharacterized protein n=1 Tax=Furfurilactobacillus curtus TaxID=1746200 RepID=A0ABQ5JPW0_9LACO
MSEHTRADRHLVAPLTKIPWALVGIFMLAQNIIWWSYPIHYGRITGATFQLNQLLLLAFSLTMSLTSFLMFQANFRSLWAHVPILIGLLLAWSGIIRGNFEILIMLLMLAGFWLVVEQRWLNLQNVWGLIIYGVLTTFPLSAAIFFFQNRYLSPTFLLNLLPLLGCQLFFTAPIFESASSRQSRTALLTGGLLILIILALRRSLLGVLAIGMVILTYFFMINFTNLKSQYRASAYLLFELIAYLLLVFA